MSAQYAEDTTVRHPLVTGGLDFEKITDVVCKPVETKAPRWWHIALLGSLSILMLLLAMIGYLVFEGVGVWGLNNPVAWGY